ncbi:hypothetical protein PR001_g10053 [Phytophthora rubi]|uniref:Sfi1 spindle body domain-containing protein n=1 Tax=Phytophthora rubi TaxID=129364 RepID=A0A6A3MLK3_9STRA|nr:hypothetical protein PR001_g10053 [Phytophthora rubi]
MREEYAAPDTDSPAQPSTWQLRFGKKSASRSQLQPKESKSGAELRPHSPDSRSPSIADQLLRALDAKPKEQEEWSRECVDQLIGRRNAFGTGPELRLRSLTKLSDNEHDDSNRENTAAEAKEIIRARFQIENQADVLRRASGHPKHPKRRAEAKYSSATQSSTSKCASRKFSPPTDSKLRHTPAQEKKPRVRLMQSEGCDNQKAETIPTMTESTVQRKSKNQQTFSTAMEQRAIERKQRREELKRKYEELEQQKRKEQEEQRAAREALLLQQRIEEKARIRERKLAEARAQQEKRDRRDQMLAQRHKASKHNRRRLLFFYALLPWRKHHTLKQRVARNATRWHELRTVYSHWGQWQQFVLMCRKRHRRRERAQMDEAAKHHARSLQRRALWGLMRHHQATEARELTVRRQHQWNSLQHTWRHWYKRLVDERTCQRELAYEAATKLHQAKLRRIFSQWRQASSDAKLQRELEHEKQQLWRKVRGWLDEED